MMQINILVTGGVYSNQAGYSAWQFCSAALTAGHHIAQVFFYQDAVSQGSVLTVPMDDEFDAPSRWVALSKQHGIKLVVCLSAAERRGLLNSDQAKEFAKPAANLHCQFEIAGLGALHQAALESDRMVTFN